VTDHARRTLAIAHSLCEQFSLDTAHVLERLTGGMERYGCENHLKPDFDARAETLAELDDCAAFAALLISRGTIDREDPLLALYLRSVATATRAMRVMLAEVSPTVQEPACREGCPLCEVPDLDSGC
jgi:hypothetical protein